MKLLLQSIMEFFMILIVIHEQATEYVVQSCSTIMIYFSFLLMYCILDRDFGIVLKFKS